MKKFFLFGLWVFFAPIYFSCSTYGLEDIDQYVNAMETTVDERFEESLSGQSKPLKIPVVQNPEHFSFLWCTDMHLRTNRRDYLDKLGMFAQRVNARFIIHSGDLADHGLLEEFNYFLVRKEEAVLPVFFAVLGNHDLYGDGWDAFKEKMGPSVTAFDYGNSRFIFIDSATCDIGRQQMDWIEDELKSARQSYWIEHIFIFSHMCLYDSTFESPTIICDPDERYLLTSLLDKYDVDFFLCGHKHSAEKYRLNGTWHIQAGTASTYKKPINDHPQFYYFQVDGENVYFEKKYFDQIDY